MAFTFSIEKNNILIEKRNISFEEVIAAIEMGNILDTFPHPNNITYPNQQIVVVKVKDYAYVVPYVIEENGDFFLKTIFPDGKLSKKYLGVKDE